MPYFILIWCLLLGGTYLTHAEEVPVDATNTAAIERMATLREQRGEAKAALTALAQGRLTNLSANVSNRFDAAVRRIENVIGRLESRLSKMEQEGKDVAAAKSKIADAKSAIAEAKAQLASIDTEVAIFVGSENPRERWKNLKAIYSGARDSIMAAHKATAETLLLLQGATTIPAPSDTSSTTAATN
jgi:chromosome segregation ATPase